MYFIQVAYDKIRTGVSLFASGIGIPMGGQRQVRQMRQVRDVRQVRQVRRVRFFRECREVLSAS
jgi:hypothetical protein